MSARKMPLTLFALALALALLPVTGMGAQSEADGLWSAWLFNYNANTLVHVYLDGKAETYTLPLPDGALPSSNPVFSPEGALVAFCMSDGQGNVSLRVHDVSAGADLVDYPLGAAAGCSVTAAAFDEDRSQIALGVLNQFPGDPNADAHQPGWELLVLDLSSGEVSYRFDANTPALADLDLRTVSAQMGFMPVVRYFRAGKIAFAAMPWGTEGVPETDGLLWDIDSGSLSLSAPYGKSVSDILEATGEIVWTDVDETLPQGEPLPALGPQFNVVMVADKTGEQQAVFSQPMNLVQARFIDDGRRLAVEMIGAFDEQAGIAPVQWVVVDRAGAVELLPAELSDYNLVNAPEGFAILHTAYRGENYTDPLTQLRYYRIRADEGRFALEATTLWEDPSEAWMIVWSPVIQVGASLPPFTPIAP